MIHGVPTYLLVEMMKVKKVEKEGKEGGK